MEYFMIRSTLLAHRNLTLACSGGWWLQNWRIGPGAGWGSVLLGVFFDLVRMDVFKFEFTGSLCSLHHISFSLKFDVGVATRAPKLAFTYIKMFVLEKCFWFIQKISEIRE